VARHAISSSLSTCDERRQALDCDWPFIEDKGLVRRDSNRSQQIAKGLIWQE
jgi:hypothetical protein